MQNCLQPVLLIINIFSLFGLLDTIIERQRRSSVCVGNFQVAAKRNRKNINGRLKNLWKKLVKCIASYWTISKTSKVFVCYTLWKQSQTNDEELKNMHSIDVLQHEKTHFCLQWQNVLRIHYAYHQLAARSKGLSGESTK